MKLLAWIAERERDFPGSSLDGSSLMQQTSGLAGDDGLPWEAVAKAAARLRKRGHLDWNYDLWPNESQEPPPESIDYMNFQRPQNITISGSGLQALAALEPNAAGRQVNIVNSFVGQIALGDITNIDLFVILDAAEQALDQLDAPQEVKTEARGVLQRMKAVGTSVASGAVAEVLAAAVRKALGLP
jgi:hypothetical protein